MTPPPSHPCEGCVLQEARDGRVCPVARDAYSLPDLEAQRHAQALHAAILADAGRTPGFAELVRSDAMSRTGALPASISLGLLAAPSPHPLYSDSPKEVIRVALPARTPR
jgi:hypothetical protein